MEILKHTKGMLNYFCFIIIIDVRLLKEKRNTAAMSIGNKTTQAGKQNTRLTKLQKFFMMTQFEMRPSNFAKGKGVKG